jgi:hypothetical protein
MRKVTIFGTCQLKAYSVYSNFFFQQINARQYVNIWGDREFQVLSQYIITFF